MNLQKTFRDRLKISEPLKPHTSFRIGGRAQYWYEPKDRHELIRFLKSAKGSMPFFIIGAGSNLLIREGLIKRIFIHLSASDFNKIHIAGIKVRVGAGVRLGRLISALSSRNIGGYEFLSGIPGTIGGALVMNAGARTDLDSAASYREMKDIVSEVEVLDTEGRHLKIKAKDLKFSYRHSNLKPYIILSAQLQLKAADKKEILKKITGILKNRFKHQDWCYPSAGSFFKNPDQGEPAGRLIDLCQLKNLKVGGAQVSAKHANFIINASGAKSTDVLRLAEVITEKVHDRFKIKLSPEVEFVS